MDSISSFRPTNNAPKQSISGIPKTLSEVKEVLTALKDWLLSLLTKIGILLHIVQETPPVPTTIQQEAANPTLDNANAKSLQDDEQNRQTTQEIATSSTAQSAPQSPTLAENSLDTPHLADDTNKEAQETVIPNDEQNRQNGEVLSTGQGENLSTDILKDRLGISSSSLAQQFATDHPSPDDYEYKVPALVAQIQDICPKDIEQIKQQANKLGLQAIVECPLEQIDFSFHIDNFFHNHEILHQARKILTTSFDKNMSPQAKQVLGATQLFIAFCQAVNDAVFGYTDLNARATEQVEATNKTHLLASDLFNIFKPENIRAIDLTNPQEISKLIELTVQFSMQLRESSMQQRVIELDLAVSAYSRAQLHALLEHLEHMDFVDEVDAKTEQDKEFLAAKDNATAYRDKLANEGAMQETETLGLKLVLYSSAHDIESACHQIKQAIDAYKELNSIEASTPLTPEHIEAMKLKIKEAYERYRSDVNNILAVHNRDLVNEEEFRKKLRDAISSIPLIVDDKTIHQLLLDAHKK